MSSAAKIDDTAADAAEMVAAALPHDKTSRCAFDLVIERGDRKVNDFVFANMTSIGSLALLLVELADIVKVLDARVDALGGEDE